MLKRDVPTGPAADLLREMLHALLPGSVERRKVDEFLEGKPAHSPLPWQVEPNGKEANIRDPSGRFIVPSVSPENAEFIGVAVNNFYALRDAALAYFELERSGDVGNLLCPDESWRLSRVLIQCGAEIKPGLTPAQAQQMFATGAMPAPPAPACPPLPPPYVGSKHPRPDTFYDGHYGLYFTAEEKRLMLDGRASANPALF